MIFKTLTSIMSAIALAFVPTSVCWASSVQDANAPPARASSKANSKSATTAAKHASAQPQLVPPPPPSPIHGDMLVPSLDPSASASGAPVPTSAQAVNQPQPAAGRRHPIRRDLAQTTDEAKEGDGGGDSVTDMSIPIESLGDDYRLAPGDVLTVIDPSLGTPDQPGETTMSVSPDGLIYLNPYGLIRARDKTVHQLSATINKLAEKYSDNPEVMVQLVRQRPINVYVLGEVMSPGLWNSKQKSFSEQEAESANTIAMAQQNNARMGANVSKFTFQSLLGGNGGNTSQSNFNPPPKVQQPPSLATLPMTALTAIQLAGGIKDSADINNVTITRRSDGKTFTMDLHKLLVNGDFSQDRALQNGDVVYVPQGSSKFDPAKLGAAANHFKYARVWGEVRVPGMYLVEPEDDLYSVIAKAGGFTPIARHSIELSRVNRDGTVMTKTIPISASLKNIDPIAREPIRPGDVIVVRAHMVKKYGPTLVSKTTLAAGAVFLLFLSANLNRAGGGILGF